MANRLFVLSNLADKSGRVRPENSLRILHTSLVKHLPEQPLIFLDDPLIPDFAQQRENDAFPEQSTFLLENLNFQPDEYGYVEPVKQHADDIIKQQKEEEELRKQQLLEEEKIREQ